ncbi:MAG: Zn-ribbon domain-containing protein [Halobacteriales archaeon]
MPHECTSCGLTFPDGSKEMLSGCPDCGGNKFQFHPGGTSPDETRSSSPGVDTPGDRPAGSSARSDVASEPSSSGESSSFTLGSLRSEEAGPDTPESTAPTGDDTSPDTEDPAQASARSTVPPGDELHKSDSGRTSDTGSSDPDPSRTPPEATDDAGPTGDVPDPPDESDPPEISELREELNDQFESIKIHARGEYELNLMELYDREEHIIALQEDGRYVIDVPSSWREASEDD